MIGNPVANWTFGILITLALSSLAAAGMNTLLVARLLLLLAVMVVAAVLFATEQGRKISLTSRGAILLTVTIACIGIERWEASNQPAPVKQDRPRIPKPPLILAMPPEQLFTIRRPVLLKEQGLLVDYIRFPVGGFAGFTRDNDQDDVMLGIPTVTLKNLSDNPMRLTWALNIKGEGLVVSLPGNGRGRWERQLNRNDFMSNRPDGLRWWLLSPADLAEGKNARGWLGFVVPRENERLRSMILSGDFDDRFRVTLKISDGLSGHQTELALPFGNKPVPNEPLRKQIREMSQN